jgi:S1-C subfamily serine protease
MKGYATLFLFLVALSSPIHADPSALKKLEERSAYYAKVSEYANKAGVGLYCKRGKYMGYYGSGVLISKDGYILTSTTVIPPGATEIRVFLSTHEVLEGTLVETDEAAESALLKVKYSKPLPFLPLATEAPSIGERAYTLGNAQNMMRFGKQGSFSVGVISGIYPVKSQDTQSSFSGLTIESDAAINPGQDGGMLLNSYGQLVGIVSLSFCSARWQGVAVPISLIKKQLKHLKEGKVAISEKKELKPLPGDDPKAMGFSGYARGIAKTLVPIMVTRKFKPEVLNRQDLESFVEEVSKDKTLDDDQRNKKIGVYNQVDKLLATNQQLRRPKNAVTGVVVSSDGFIITSLFNMSPDEAWMKDGKVKLPAFTTDFAKLTSKEGMVRGLNPVIRISVTLPDGRAVPAKMVSRHIPLGLAMLKIDAKDLAFLDLKSRAATSPKTGSPCAVVGWVKGDLGYTMNTGMISSQFRSRKQRFQYDAIINYANSGGPVIGRDGTVLGIALSPMVPLPTMGRVWSGQDILRWQIAPNSGVSMAARADLLLVDLETLKKGQSVRRIKGPYIGIAPDNNPLSETVRLSLVQPLSPADKAGVKVGDILTTFNGSPIKSWKNLIDELDGLSVGDSVPIEVVRPGRKRYFILNGKPVRNDKEMKALMLKLKNGDRIEGTYVDVKDELLKLTLTLGDRP